MYSRILFMVDRSFMALTRSGFTQTSDVASTANSVSSGARPVKVT